MKKTFSKEDTVEIAESLSIDFGNEQFDFNDFFMGVNVELEHGTNHIETNVTNDNPIVTGKIALAHLTEFPDYYQRLEKMEDEAKIFWANKRG